MRQKSGPHASTTEQIVKVIRRATGGGEVLIIVLCSRWLWYVAQLEKA